MTKRRQHGETGSDTPVLPALITAVKPQKHQKDRFSLFHESIFLIGISSETVVSLDIKAGTTLTRKLLTEIEIHEQKTGLKSWLFRLLGRRDHARAELEAKAYKKGYRQPDITEALDKLEEKGYIDDESFAEKFTSDKVSLGKWGPKKVENELVRRGVSRKVAAGAIDRMRDNLQLREICVDLAVGRRKRFLREMDGQKRKKKIISFLLQRGFHYETINKALPDILLNLDV